MKKWSFVLAAASLAFLLTACTGRIDQAYESGYHSGYSEGYDAGFDDGYDDCRENSSGVSDYIYKAASAAEDYAAENAGMTAEEAFLILDMYFNPDPADEPITWQEYMDALDAISWYYNYFSAQVYCNEFGYFD